MNLGELRDLVDQTSELEDNVEVKFASQPSWPFEYSINDYHVIDRENGDQEIFFEEGTQLGYLPGEVKDEICW
jgi:hypothetical protein